MQVLVLPHVAKRVERLSRRAQRACMVAIGEDPAAALELEVQVLREPDAEALHATRELTLALGFHHEMHVVRLHGVFDDTKHLPELVRGFLQHAADGGKYLAVSQALHARGYAHRHVHGMVPGVGGPRCMGQTTLGGGLPGSSASPPLGFTCGPTLHGDRLPNGGKHELRRDAGWHASSVGRFWRMSSFALVATTIAPVGSHVRPCLVPTIGAIGAEPKAQGPKPSAQNPELPEPSAGAESREPRAESREPRIESPRA